jgi:hypothetical protein
MSNSYDVYIAGSKLPITADTPEEAAIAGLQSKGWRSVRSIAVMGDGVHFEFLDCEIVDGKLHYAETSPLPDYREVERYNRDIDARNRIAYVNREKPWLPLYDGE